MKSAKDKAPEQPQLQPTDTKPLVKLFKRMAFDWFLLIGLFLPFMIFTIARFLPFNVMDFDGNIQDAINNYFGNYPGGQPKTHNPQPGMNSVTGRSLSSLAWILNAGWGTLIFSLVFVIGFMVYQAFLFTRINGGRKRRKMNVSVIAVMIAGAVIMTVGSFLPIDIVDTTLGDWHSYLCQIGAVIMVLATGLMVTFFCIVVKGKWRTKSIAITAFAVLTALAVVGIIVLPFFSALFSLASTFMAMVYVHYFTVTYELTNMQTG